MPRKYLTLFDELQADVAHKKTRHAYLRPLLPRARAFVLDDAMSAFLAPLATEAFNELVNSAGLQQANVREHALSAVYEGDDEIIDKVRSKVVKLADGMRQLARAPHAVTWIEFDFNKRYDRYRELYASEYHMPPDMPKRDERDRMGWLIEQSPHSNMLFRLTMVSQGMPERDMPLMVVPFSALWHCSNETIEYSTAPANWQCKPYFGADRKQNSLFAFSTTELDQLPALLVTNEMTDKYERWAVDHIAKEFRGELRYVWALLASINDLPVGVREVKSNRGYMARGNYRKFLDHSVITLTIPKRSSEKRLAKVLVAISRRRAHEVRGHFRRVGPDKVRKWIAEHVRGDATLGWVTHSYKVEREKTDA